jgi:hypothetical protein
MLKILPEVTKELFKSCPYEFFCVIIPSKFGGIP